MFDVVCIGNALIDSFLSIHEANEYCRVDRQTNELCIKTGQKIPLENAQFELGGNACNVSVGLSRLGFHTALIAEFGNDAFAHKIKKQLDVEHVSLTHTVSTDTQSSFSIGINFKNDRSLFVWHVERKHELVLDSFRTKWVYLSSMGESWRHVYRSIPASIRDLGYKLAFNPGTRQIAAGGEVLEPILAVTDILFLNKEEGMRIAYGREQKMIGNNRDLIERLAKKLQSMGPNIVVITDGTHGSYALDTEGELYHEGCLDMPIIERTGAGDSYASGFLAAILYGQEVSSAIQWGAINAASVIGKVGAQPGLLTKEQMLRRV